ncbi:DUF192 domain-containing protein [Bacillus pinisoli]|uniref:DUF192 domain-containing protein n=1 Tax=Bacillus pinisoli TaxID=2901866 RepID=UPI001FF1C076|nr:DUF192 domain-containing protein [Bacillus pinisoli]
MKLFNQSNNEELAAEVGRAYSFFKRLQGLMFSKELPQGCGLHLKPCQSIHTYFMNYPIDVVFVNQQLEVVGIVESISPSKATKVYRSAKSVFELPAGTVSRTNTNIGDVLVIKES